MKRILLPFVALLLALTGCSPYTLVDSESYQGANLANYHTFRMVYPGLDSVATLPPGMSMVTYYNIAAAIREQMVERGFVESPESPLLVNIGLTVRKELVNTPVTQMIPTPGPGPLLPPVGGWIGTPPPPVNGMVPYFMYPRAYYWPNYTTVTQWVPSIYREGVLTIDLVDMQRRIPVYTASVATILDNGDSQLRNLSGIAAAVKVLFSKFPVPIQTPAK